VIVKSSHTLCCFRTMLYVWLAICVAGTHRRVHGQSRVWFRATGRVNRTLTLTLTLDPPAFVDERCCAHCPWGQIIRAYSRYFLSIGEMGWFVTWYIRV